MFKYCPLLAVLILAPIIATSVEGGDCNRLGLVQAFGSMDMQGIKVCFVYTKTEALYEGQLSVDPDGISMYSMPEFGEHEVVYEFPYAGTKGKIDDAFVLPMYDMREKKLFVIHSIEVPRAWEMLSDVYDVSVIELQGGVLRRNQVLSNFFNMGGDKIGVDGSPNYVYPYKNRRSIEKAIRSPEFKVVHASMPKTGRVKHKTFLYGGGAEPLIHGRKYGYLIEGDEFTVIDSVAGWCKGFYAAKKKLLIAWMSCRSITFMEN